MKSPATEYSEGFLEGALKSLTSQPATEVTLVGLTTPPMIIAESTPAKTKPPRHVSVAIRHLQAQRNKAVSDRDKAAKQVEDLDHALQSLGYPEDDDE